MNLSFYINFHGVVSHLLSISFHANPDLGFVSYSLNGNQGGAVRKGTLLYHGR